MLISLPYAEKQISGSSLTFPPNSEIPFMNLCLHQGHLVSSLSAGDLTALQVRAFHFGQLGFLESSPPV